MLPPVRTESVFSLLLWCNMAFTYQQMSPLPTKNSVGISNKKQLEIKCRGDKKDKTPAFQL